MSYALSQFDAETQKKMLRDKGLIKHVITRRHDNQKLIEHNCINPGKNCENYMAFSNISHDIIDQYILWVTYRRCLKKVVSNYYKQKHIIVGSHEYKAKYGDYGMHHSSAAANFDLDDFDEKADSKNFTTHFISKPTVNPDLQKIKIGFTTPSINQIKILDPNLWDNGQKQYLLNCMTACDIGYIRVKRTECDILKPELGYYSKGDCCRRINEYTHNLCSSKPYEEGEVNEDHVNYSKVVKYNEKMKKEKFQLMKKIREDKNLKSDSRQQEKFNTIKYNLKHSKWQEL